MKHNLLFKAICASSLIALTVTGSFAQGVIRTIAGTGVSGFSGDGGPALGATLSNPSGVSADQAGDIFVADQNNHRIRKILGINSAPISTVVGNGMYGYSGMGGPALSAGMEYPYSVFVDNTGNLLITDFYADCSYTVGGGTINNSCGHGSQGCTGDGGDAPSATMELPKGIWKDVFGNTYVADYGCNRIRRVDALTDIVTTITGSGSFGFSPDGTLASVAQFSSISGVCVDNTGVIYLSDAGNHVVRKIDLTGHVYTVAGSGVSGYSGDGGPALSATLMSPEGLFVNSSYLFICDPTSNVVRAVNLTTGIITTFAGTGVAGFSGDGGAAVAAELSGPTAIWEVSSGRFVIADAGNNRIRRVIDPTYRASGTAVTTLTGENGFTVFPNPSNGTFTVQTTGALVNAALEVYDVIGVKVYSQDIVNMETTLSLNLPAGMYHVMLRSAEGSSVQKIVISK